MTDRIKFILNGRETEVENLPPVTTLLQYLRLHAHLPGTKEGCAEGDCGACTVAVCHLKNGKPEFQSINSCIAFLPTMDGREVVTVEHLKSKTGALNPVQDAMVKCHGSQCGFCTPEFVMALSTLMNNTKNANDEDIQDSIAGNLCRCTGYRPIIDAARMANENTDRALPSSPELLKKIQRDKMFSYEGGDGKFFAPVTAQELADVYAQHPTATILAGGTDVGLWVTKFHMDLPVIIYTGNIAELKQVKETAEGLEIGGAASYTDAFTALAAYGPTMEDMLKRFASIHLRNVGTIGGNIANGSPIGDGPPPLIALAAKLVLRSKAGSRTINLEDFFIAYRKQDRKPGEFVEKIIVPKKAAGVQFRVYKNSKRFDEDISAVCAAFAVDIQNGQVVSARIAFGGMAATPKRAGSAEKILTGAAWDWPTVQKAMAALDADYQPMSDARASAKYRSDIARNLLRRFYIETTEPDTKTQVYRYAE